jgi:hypothetical protein
VARVTTREVSGFKTCGRPRVVDSASWADDVVLTDDCAHYIESQPCELIEETVEWTFVDNGADPATPGFDAHKVERSTTHLKPADGNRACDACGFEESNFSLTPRMRYMSRSEQSQDELRRRSMQADRRQAEQVSAAERQAAALEALARQGEENGRVAQLERELAELRELLAAQANGHDDEPAPARPRPKAKV